MGEAKQRRRRQDREWVKLFGDEFPAVCISRPARRPETIPTRELQSFVAMINERGGTPKSLMCFDDACGAELHSPPEVFAALKTSPDQITMGVCPSCAEKTDEDLLAIMRDEFGGRFGLDGHAPQGVATVEVPSCITIESDVPGLTVAIFDDNLCDVALMFLVLLEERKLPRFSSFWRGTSNCHGLTDVLFWDFEELEIEAKRKTGFSALPTTTGAPLGLHSWLEIAGWVIDGGSGGLGLPVKIQRLEPHYALMQITDVHDRHALPTSIGGIALGAA